MPSLVRRSILLALPALIIPRKTFAGMHGKEFIGTIKLTVVGASNTALTTTNNNMPYWVQATGGFKHTITVELATPAGNSAATDSVPATFNAGIANHYDAAFTLNILSMQYGGGNTGDIDDTPLSAVTYSNNEQSIAQQWKTLNPSNKVAAFTTWAYGCPNSAQVANYATANSLVLGNAARFIDAIVNSQAADSVFTPSTSCPSVSISPDCNHLTQAGQLLVVPAYIAAVNSVF